MGKFMPPGTSYTVTGMRWLNDGLQIALKDDYGNVTGFLVEWGCIGPRTCMRRQS